MNHFKPGKQPEFTTLHQLTVCSGRSDDNSYRPRNTFRGRAAPFAHPINEFNSIHPQHAVDNSDPFTIDPLAITIPEDTVWDLIVDHIASSSVRHQETSCNTAGQHFHSRTPATRMPYAGISSSAAQKPVGLPSYMEEPGVYYPQTEIGWCGEDEDPSDRRVHASPILPPASSKVDDADDAENDDEDRAEEEDDEDQAEEEDDEDTASVSTFSGKRRKARPSRTRARWPTCDHSLFPPSNVRHPRGLSWKDIFARYPNHINDNVVKAALDAGYKARRMYDLLPSIIRKQRTNVDQPYSFLQKRICVVNKGHGRNTVSGTAKYKCVEDEDEDGDVEDEEEREEEPPAKKRKVAAKAPIRSMYFDGPPDANAAKQEKIPLTKAPPRSGKQQLLSLLGESSKATYPYLVDKLRKHYGSTKGSSTTSEANDSKIEEELREVEEALAYAARSGSRPTHRGTSSPAQGQEVVQGAEHAVQAQTGSLHLAEHAGGRAGSRAGDGSNADMPEENQDGDWEWDY